MTHSNVVSGSIDAQEYIAPEGYMVSAHACSPYKGSLPAVGWGFVSALARIHDLWVIVVEEKFRAEIERYLAENQEFDQSARFLFVHKRRNRPLRKLWPPPTTGVIGAGTKAPMSLPSPRASD